MGLWANMPMIQAKRDLQAALHGEFEMDETGWYDLTLAATGSKQQAEEAALASMQRQLRTPSHATPETSGR